MNRERRGGLATATTISSLCLVLLLFLTAVICLGRDAHASGIILASTLSPLTGLSGGVVDWPKGQIDGPNFVRIGVGFWRQSPNRMGEIAPNICRERPNDHCAGLTGQHLGGELGGVAMNSRVSKLTIAQSPYLNVAAPEEKLPPLSCSEQFETLLSGKVLRFEFNSSTINPNGLRILGRLVQFIDACPESRIEIAGHTDSLGAEDFNRKLSRRRAKAVVDYLISEGVRKGQLKSVGYGESLPIADNDTLKGQARNRRVEFKYLQEGA